MIKFNKAKLVINKAILKLENKKILFITEKKFIVRRN